MSAQLQICRGSKWMHTDKQRRFAPLYHRRIELNMTMEQIEELTGIQAQRISRYELGINLPRVDAAIRLAKALSTTVEQLFEGAI